MESCAAGLDGGVSGLSGGESCFCEGGGASSAGRERLGRSSSASARTAILVPTLMPLAPSACCSTIQRIAEELPIVGMKLTIIFANLPSSWASTSIVALSVSISSSTSPGAKESPENVSILSAPQLNSFELFPTFLDLPTSNVAFGHCWRHSRHGEILSGQQFRACLQACTLNVSIPLSQLTSWHIGET